MNLLFVIVVAVFWALGGILKAKSNKPEQKERIGPPRRPARRPQGQGPGLQVSRQAGERPRPGPAAAEKSPQYRPASKAPAGEAVFSHPLFRNLAAQIERATGIKIPTETPKPVAVKKPPRPQTEKIVPAVETARPPQDRSPEVVTELPDALLLDTSDPDDLRRAILYYEILGKPVSLRDSSDSVIGL